MHPIHGILFKIVCCKLAMEVCGKKKGRTNHEDIWWWNEEMKEAIQQKKVAHKKMWKNQLKENKAKYRNFKT